MPSRRFTQWFPMALLTTTLLVGCAGLRPEAEPTPVSGNHAVVALVDAAHIQTVAGKLESANASLERALRIEPRNPALWHELAQLRLQQGQWRQAESLAKKSNGWAREDISLRADNWRLIGHARAQRGDAYGAQTAFDKAAEYDKTP